jgi:hypothetical protein
MLIDAAGLVGEQLLESKRRPRPRRRLSSTRVISSSDVDTRMRFTLVLEHQCRKQQHRECEREQMLRKRPRARRTELARATSEWA